MHGPGEREAQRRGHRGAVGLVHGRVEQRDTDEEVGVVDGPAEGDDAAPVVAEGDDRPGETEGVGEGAQVGDAAGERAVLARAGGEPHLELVDGDDAPRRAATPGGGDGVGHEPPPQVGPRRVAVHGQHRADGRDAVPLELRTGVEVVPGRAPGVAQHVAVPRVQARQPVRDGAGGAQEGIGRGHEGGPGHQASSSIAVLMPEPTPMSSTRSPALSVSCSSTSVIGTDAGPTLPNRS
ncbi:Uncharacterised protein [Mycobacteroides abscessus]|nr:Uncharacterised protein [Mycobacteroides abscessus]